MLLCPNPTPTRHRQRDAGFTLIEVIVALGLLLLVSAALYPQVIVGLRATGVARDLTQVKGIAQARLEHMRAMPFYVGREAGDYIDILDTYYRNTTPPAVVPDCTGTTLTALPPTTWAGYVPASAKHCAWEPPGPLYRRVINPIEAPGLGAFAMVVSTQFLSGSATSTSIAPLIGYNTQTAGKDMPPSSQVGTTVNVFFRSHNGVKYATTYSQMERSSAIDPLIQSKAKATTVQVSSSARTWGDWSITSPDPADINNDQPNLLTNIGVIDLSGELFTGSRVVANATGAAGSTSLPTAVSGARTNLIAPIDTLATGSLVGSATLPNGCRWMCFGTSQTSAVSATSVDGLPRAGTSTAPARASIPASATNSGFWFDNGKWRDRLRLLNNTPMVSLDTSGNPTIPSVANCQVGGATSTLTTDVMAATGFIDATSDDLPNPTIRACATAQAHTVRVFPTTFAPGGVIRISLDSATANCQVDSSASIANANYDATVQYWNNGGYTTVAPLNKGNASDPLDGVDRNQIIDASSGMRLSDYVQSWSSVIDSDIERNVGPSIAEVDMPAVVTVHTGHTRTFTSGWGPNNTDTTSAISLAIGEVSCKALDRR